MKKLNLLVILITINLTHYAQDFTWMHGSTTASAPAVYGTQGIPSPANTPGGRHGSGRWTDASGNLWLFGGEGPYFSWWNDLWKYDISTNEWTWIRGANTPDALSVYGTMGVSSPANEPGAREFMNCWTDAAGNFWMFGGDGFAATTQTVQERLGDLWKYNPSTNEWTWMNGFTLTGQNGIYGTMGTPAASNAPGGRFGSCTWTDSNDNLWMFGGHGHAAIGADAYLNDLWKYNTTTNQWTWVSGTNSFNQNAVYGTISVPSSANMPGSKYFSVGWIDASDNLFLFGGNGFNGSNSLGRQNELWKFDPVAGSWTWINGSQSISTPGVYGTQNVSSPSNVIGGRQGSAGWKDPGGNFWVFGGNGVANSMITDDLNDLWKYDPITNEWTWIKGSMVLNQNGTFGTQGVAAPANIPGAREASTYWATPTKLWMYGGLGLDISSPMVSERLGDLWSFKLPCNPDSITASSGNAICSGASATLSAVNGGSTTIWYDSPSSANSISTGSTLVLPGLTTAGTSTVFTYYAVANSCTYMPRTSVSITVNPSPSLTLSALSLTICKGQTATLTATGADSYSWTNVSGANTTSVQVVSPVNTTSYTVIGINTNECTDTSMVVQHVSNCTGIQEIAADKAYSLYPNPNKGTFNLNVKESLVNTRLTIFNALGQLVMEREITSSQTQINSDLRRGLYYYQITTNGTNSAAGKLVIE